MIVIDTNILVYLLIKGYEEQLSVEVFKKERNWASPTLSKHEFSSALLSHFRHGIIDQSQVNETIKIFNKFTKNRLIDVGRRETFELARNSNLSLYDCEFVALAKRLNSSLITHDKKIIREFPAIAIHPNDFVLD